VPSKSSHCFVPSLYSKRTSRPVGSSLAAILRSHKLEEVVKYGDLVPKRSRSLANIVLEQADGVDEYISRVIDENLCFP